MRGWIIKKSMPITKFLGEAHAPFTRKKITGNDYRHAKGILVPGDVVLVRTRGEFSNLFIPGFWTHASIYVGDECIVEATGSGVHETDLVTFMMHKDYVGIFSPKFAGPAAKLAAADWASSQIGKPYDYSFSGGNEAFYCSELVTAAYTEVMGRGACPFVPRERYGQLTTTPQDFADAKTKWNEVWRS